MTSQPFDVLIMTGLLDELNALIGVITSQGSAWTEERDPSGFRHHACQLGPLKIAAAWGKWGKLPHDGSLAPPSR